MLKLLRPFHVPNSPSTKLLYTLPRIPRRHSSHPLSIIPPTRLPSTPSSRHRQSIPTAPLVATASGQSINSLRGAVSTHIGSSVPLTPRPHSMAPQGATSRPRRPHLASGWRPLSPRSHVHRPSTASQNRSVVSPPFCATHRAQRPWTRTKQPTAPRGPSALARRQTTASTPPAATLSALQLAPTAMHCPPTPPAPRHTLSAHPPAHPHHQPLPLPATSVRRHLARLPPPRPSRRMRRRRWLRVCARTHATARAGRV